MAGAGPDSAALLCEARDRLLATEKSAWAAGIAADVITTTLTGPLALPVYNIELGIISGLVALAVAIPRFFDARPAARHPLLRRRLAPRTVPRRIVLGAADPPFRRGRTLLP